jgi:hypothetical protein
VARLTAAATAAAGGMITRMSSMSLGAQALAELRRRDEERGVDPIAPTPTVMVRPPAKPPEPLHIAPWDGSSFRDPPQPVREPNPPLHSEDEQTLPAKPKPKSSTPNLDRWRAEQMKRQR